MEFPIYELKIQDDLQDDAEVSYIALVDKPAIQKDFIAFAEEIVQKSMTFAIQNEDKHIISGPLMLADQLIYRENKKFGEHFVRFSAETIKDIAIKFAKKGYQQNVNLMHSSDMKLDGFIMFESFIVDKERGILPMQGFEDAKDGSWFGSFYVENPKAWELIKEGKVKGFSVEGFFDYVMPENREQSYAQRKLAELSALLKVPNH